MGDNANVICGEHGPSISNVTSLNDMDFESMMETPDEDTADSKDVVFMRLGGDTIQCRHCGQQCPSMMSLEQHMKECHLCEFCDQQFPEKEKLILHLKSHLMRSTLGVKQSLKMPSFGVNQSMKMPTIKVQNKGKAKFLKKGFYHPAIKQPDGFEEQQKNTKRVSVFKAGSGTSSNSKPKTQYYIYKEKGQVKRVIKTVFKPKPSKEKIAVRDELSSDLDDLLRTFEAEDPGPVTTESPTATFEPRADFGAHQEEEEDPLRIDTSDCHCEMDDSVEKEIDEISRTKEILEDIESLHNEEIEKSTVCEVEVLRKGPIDEFMTNFEDNEIFSKPPPKLMMNSKDAGKKKTKCLLCEMKFADFRQLLWHITNKHFKSEMNNIITEKYPGFWRSEKMKENKEHVCEDCGHRMRTRGQIQNHFGVTHNLLWDIYLKKVQSNKKTIKPQNEPTERQTVKSLNEQFTEQTGNITKKKKSKQDQNFDKTSQKTPIDEGKLTSFYRDSKLILIPDENPYSKRFIFGSKKKSGSYSFTTPMANVSDRFSLLETIATNVGSSLHEPYCSICQILLDPTSRAKLRETTTKSLEKVPDQSSVWIPSAATQTKISPLIVCRRCKLCVHTSCYSPDTPPSADWTCDSCTAETRHVACALCGAGGGALRLTTDHTLCHVTCALLVPEVTITSGGLVDLTKLPTKRSNPQCLLCDQRGRPVVHCQASSTCTLALHTGCAIRDNIDVVIGPEPGSIIMRCSFCVEKFSLAREATQRKFPDNDLKVGESVQVTRSSGQKSLGVLTDISSDDVYFSVAFDDGTFCDSLEPADVTFKSEEERSENCPVSVVWEGGTYSGVFKGSNILYWYKVQAVDLLDTLEVNRSSISKLL